MAAVGEYADFDPEDGRFGLGSRSSVLFFGDLVLDGELVVLDEGALHAAQLVDVLLERRSRRHEEAGHAGEGALEAGDRGERGQVEQVLDHPLGPELAQVVDPRFRRRRRPKSCLGCARDESINNTHSSAPRRL